MANIGNISTGAVTATRGSALRNIADQWNDVINVKDYGAVCDGVTDDAPAYNAAFTELRTRVVSGQMAARIVFPGGVSMIKSTINGTLLRSGRSTLIDGGGTTLYGQTSGTPVLDLMGSLHMRVENLQIYGSSTTPPNIGLLIGRTDIGANQSADDHTIQSVAVEGQFTFAAVYNFSAEITTWIKLAITNTYASSSCYGLVQDGMNHFGISSAFAPQLAPADTAQSFNNNVFIGADIRSSGGGTPIWISHSRMHCFHGGYVAQIGAGPAMILYGGTAGQGDTYGNSLLHLDLHMETGTTTDVFLITGPNTTPLIQGLFWSDYLPSIVTAGSVFNLDTGVTAATLEDLTIKVAHMSASRTFFDVPANYTVSGDIYVPVGTSWNLPAANFAGKLNIGGGVSFPAQSTNVQVLTAASGTFTQAPGSTFLQMELWGSGGSGGAGPSLGAGVSGSGGAGGGGGAHKKWGPFPWASLGSTTCQYFVPAPAAAGVSGTVTRVTNSGILLAQAGSGGGGGNGTAAATSGGGGGGSAGSNGVLGGVTGGSGSGGTGGGSGGTGVLGAIGIGDGGGGGAGTGATGVATNGGSTASGGAGGGSGGGSNAGATAIAGNGGGTGGHVGGTSAAPGATVTVESAPGGGGSPSVSSGTAATGGAGGFPGGGGGGGGAGVNGTGTGGLGGIGGGGQIVIAQW